jgi:hypothetical protein
MNGPVFLAVGLLYIAPALHISDLNDQTTCQLLDNFMSKILSYDIHVKSQKCGAVCRKLIF